MALALGWLLVELRSPLAMLHARCDFSFLVWITGEL